MANEHIESKCRSCVHSKACAAWIQHGSTLYSDFSYSVEDCPDYLPSADVVEVKHGHWTIDTREYRYGLEDDIDEEFFLKCSECGREVWLSDWTAIQGEKYEEILKEYPYCHCGAKMDISAKI